jgi:hypothetical protein
MDDSAARPVDLAGASMVKSGKREARRKKKDKLKKEKEKAAKDARAAEKKAKKTARHAPSSSSLSPPPPPPPPQLPVAMPPLHSRVAADADFERRGVAPLTGHIEPRRTSKSREGMRVAMKNEWEKELAGKTKRLVPLTFEDSDDTALGGAGSGEGVGVGVGAGAKAFLRSKGKGKGKVDKDNGKDKSSKATAPVGAGAVDEVARSMGCVPGGHAVVAGGVPRMSDAECHTDGSGGSILGGSIVGGSTIGGGNIGSIGGIGGRPRSKGKDRGKTLGAVGGRQRVRPRLALSPLRSSTVGVRPRPGPRPGASVSADGTRDRGGVGGGGYTGGGQRRAREKPPFPGPDIGREGLLAWLQGELRRKRVGSSRLMGFMDDNRSGTASFKEFATGLSAVDFDLKRDESMRLFKAVDGQGGDLNVTMKELKLQLYGTRHDGSGSGSGGSGGDNDGGSGGSNGGGGGGDAGSGAPAVGMKTPSQSSRGRRSGSKRSKRRSSSRSPSSGGGKGGVSKGDAADIQRTKEEIARLAVSIGLAPWQGGERPGGQQPPRSPTSGTSSTGEGGGAGGNGVGNGSGNGGGDGGGVGGEDEDVFGGGCGHVTPRGTPIPMMPFRYAHEKVAKDALRANFLRGQKSAIINVPCKYCKTLLPFTRSQEYFECPECHGANVRVNKSNLQYGGGGGKAGGAGGGGKNRSPTWSDISTRRYKERARDELVGGLNGIIRELSSNVTLKQPFSPHLWTKLRRLEHAARRPRMTSVPGPGKYNIK